MCWVLNFKFRFSGYFRCALFTFETVSYFCREYMYIAAAAVDLAPISRVKCANTLMVLNSLNRTIVYLDCGSAAGCCEIINIYFLFHVYKNMSGLSPQCVVKKIAFFFHFFCAVNFDDSDELRAAAARSPPTFVICLSQMSHILRCQRCRIRMWWRIRSCTQRESAN